MKNNKTSIKELVITAYKALAFLVLFVLFMGILGADNPSLLRPSRTAAVTYLTFVLGGAMMSMIYGGLDIGIRKSKPIFYSLALATFFTDLLTYLVLMIMNTNPTNNPNFRLENLGHLAVAYIAQLVIIRLMASAGNALYFYLYPPKRTLIIVGENSLDTRRVRGFLEQYRKQYRIELETSEHNPNLERMIPDYNLVVLVDVNGKNKQRLTGVCYWHGVDFAFAPSVEDTIEISGKYTVYDDKPMVEITAARSLTLSQRMLKRLMDILLSAIALVVISPIMLIVAAAIKADDGGSVFYRQERLTKDGQKFRIIKFRTMKPNDNRTLAKIDDDRITRVGKVLRRLRIDELPQVLNILNGDMSIVGPRPEQEHLFKTYEKDFPEFAYRLKVKAGLTGEAQIAGKYNTSPRDKLLLDLNYIQNYSIWRDIKLIFQTVTVFFKKDSTEGIQNEPSQPDDKLKIPLQ